MIFQSAAPSLPPLSSVETRVMAAMAHNHRFGTNGHPAGAGFDGLSVDLCDHALARSSSPASLADLLACGGSLPSVAGSSDKGLPHEFRTHPGQ